MSKDVQEDVNPVELVQGLAAGHDCVGDESTDQLILAGVEQIPKNSLRASPSVLNGPALGFLVEKDLSVEYYSPKDLRTLIRAHFETEDWSDH